MGNPRTPYDERELLAAAGSGEHDAFRRLVEPHREYLHTHAYRMLASLHDADDVLQEALLRSWRWLASFDGRSSFRTWLYRITTNTCLDAIAERPKHVLPIDYGPSSSPAADASGAIADVTWLEPYPDELLGTEDEGVSPEARYEKREAVELAFIAALQHLPPRQRAVLILRDVLGFSAREVANTLGTSPAAVNSALQRARKTVDGRVPRRSQLATARAIGDDRLLQVVERFTDAFEHADTGAILELLTDDATFSALPDQQWCRGREAIAESWLMPEGPPGRFRFIPTRLNGQPAAAAYVLAPDGTRYVPLALDVLTLRDGSIEGVTVFQTPHVFTRFGLPEELTA
jgi:RNA polymerase sigma-70 factor (ECF subfamily)